jgi:hypothetical protein
MVAFLVLCPSVSYATGPNNQFVPNPAPANANTFSSVVGVVSVDAAGDVDAVGTGTVIDSRIVNGVGYLCVLTADHVVKAGVSRIVFPNFVRGMPPPGVGTKPIVNQRQVAGIAPGQNVDANVILVRYGTPDAFYFNVPDKTLASGVGVGNKLADIGFGQTGTPNFNAQGNLVSLTATGGGEGDKRYQNNLLTGFFPNNTSPAHGAYKENDIEFTFDAQGTANFTAGEGYGYRGDSGGPLFNNGVTFDPGGGLPLIASTDSIAGVLAFTPRPASVNPGGTAVNGDVEFAVDVFDYKANIWAACAAELSTIPEPSTLVLLAAASGSWLAGWCVRRQRRGHPPTGR